MLRYIILFTLFAGAAFSQITQRNLLAGKFTLADVKASLVARKDWHPYPQTPAEWKARVPQATLDAIVKKGEESLGKDVPYVSATLMLEYVRTGDRGHYQEKSFARRNQLMDLVLAESVEDKGRFTDTIVNYVWAICEETYWGVPAHLSVQKAKNGLPDVSDPIVELFGAETAATLALTDYLVGPKLDKVSPLLRKRIYSETIKKIIEPISHSERYSWLDPTKAVNNWDPWIVSNVLIADLLIEPDETKRAANAYQYAKLLDIYINGLGPDGGCDEGPSYWFAAGGSVFDTLEILDSATAGKVNIYKDPFVQKIGAYIYKMHIADNYFVDFADADPKFNGDGLLLYRFGKAIGDDTLTQFGLQLSSRGKLTVGEGFQKPRRINNILTLNAIAGLKSTYKPADEAWLADIQVMTARTKSGLFLATHGGHNAESHNHNDVGDFIVYLAGEPVIIDTGRGNYTAKTFSSKRYDLWFTESQYHNLPIVNGIGQRDGRQFAASDVKQNSSATEDMLFMNIAKAYPKEAGIDFWNRTVKLDRSNEKVLISDDYALSKAPSSLQQIFMTVCDVDTSVPGTIKLTTPKGKIVSLAYNAADWTVSIEKPSMEGPEYSSFTSKWDNHPISRIVLTNKTLKAKDTLRYAVSVN